MINSNEFAQIVSNLSRRIHDLEVRDQPPEGSTTVAALPASSAAIRGRVMYVTNGRKVGEGAGAGTGTLAYNDGTAWRRVGDDTTVAA